MAIWNFPKMCELALRSVVGRSVGRQYSYFLYWSHILLFRYVSNVARGVKIWLRQWMGIYMKNIAVKFHPDLIWNDRALGFFGTRHPQQEEQQDE